jgi:hypothetical protein
MIEEKKTGAEEKFSSITATSALVNQRFLLMPWTVAVEQGGDYIAGHEFLWRLLIAELVPAADVVILANSFFRSSFEIPHLSGQLVQKVPSRLAS